MKVDQSHSRNILKKVWYPIRQTYSNFCNYRRAPLGSTLFCTGLGAIPLGSIFCLAPEILTQLCSVTPFLEPSTLLCFALEPSSLAPEMSHMALSSDQSQVTRHRSCGTRLRVLTGTRKMWEFREVAGWLWQILAGLPKSDNVGQRPMSEEVWHTL